MKRDEFKRVNLILGCLVGGIIGYFILTEGALLIRYLSSRNGSGNYSWIKYLFAVVAIFVFLGIVKRFISSKMKKLTMYFILAVSISMIVVLLTLYMLISLVGVLYLEVDFNAFLESNLGYILLYNLPYLLLVGMVGVFVCCFILLTNRKVKYIQYISQEIKQIQNEGFGRTLELRGDDELTELCMSINTMSLELLKKQEHERQLEQNKNELITNVSHDLRTPLTSIIGYVSLLKKEGTENKGKFEEYINVVERRLQGLHGLINELFEYTKLNSAGNPMRYTRVDIIGLINHLVSEYTILMQKEELRLEKRIDVEECYMSIDVEKVARVLQNLLDNARKYAKPYTVVLLTVIKGEEYLHINIENETEHLQDEELTHLFERFYKGDKARSESDSSGLGLSIVKRIVELHEGKIDVGLENGRISFEVCFHLEK